MRRRWMIAGLACLALGCAQGAGSAGGGEILITNSTPWPCRLTVALSGVETVMDVSGGESLTYPFEECPAEVSLVKQVFNPDATAVETAFGDWAGGRLARGANYDCGDRIVIEIAENGTSTYTEAAR